MLLRYNYLYPEWQFKFIRNALRFQRKLQKTTNRGCLRPRSASRDNTVHNCSLKSDFFAYLIKTLIVRKLVYTMGGSDDPIFVNDRGSTFEHAILVQR